MSSHTSNDPQQDDNISQKPQKKGRVIEPLNADDVKKSLTDDKALSQTNADVLAELAAKTAALAEKVAGKESIDDRTLVLDDTFDSAPEIRMSPQSAPHASGELNPAADLIRAKLQSIYKKEPDAGSEAAEAVATIHRSKHQQFMYELTTSGKSLADIQTAWHNYYVALPDDEKHTVWQEFYNAQSAVSAYARHTNQSEKEDRKTQPMNKSSRKKHSKLPALPFDARSGEDIKSQLLDKISAGGKLQPIHHVKSALFGLGLAGFVGLVIAFLFFNEVFIAPFVSPSRTVSATPIVGQVDGAVSPDPKIIIPKINLEVPVVYGLGTIEEQAIQDGLEDGVVHYAASPEPGEQGNAVIVGHSSNNILNSGKYKFAFVLLRRMEKEDTFFVHKDGVRYTYKIYDKKVVPPTDVSVLGPADRDNTITLITCDPPGTSRDRLILVAEQISPDPSTNAAATIDLDPTESVEALPSNAPSLWSRLWPF